MSKEIIIDPVVDRFNYEVPYSDKHDMEIEVLSGLPDSYRPSLSGLSGVLNGEPCMCRLGLEYNNLGQLSGVSYNPVVMGTEFLVRTKKHLINTHKTLRQNPELLSDQNIPAQFIQDLEFLLANFDDAKLRESALNKLAAKEGLNGLGGFFSKIKDAVKAVGKGVSNAAKWTGKTISKGASGAWEGIKNAAEWTGKAIVKYNPITAAIRNAFLLGMKLNLFQVSERIGYGLLTQTQVIQRGMDVTEWKRLRDRYKKIQNLHIKIGGSGHSFDENLRAGFKKGTGESLGLVATTTAAAATPLLMKAISYIKDVDWDNLLKTVGKVQEYMEVDSKQPVDHYANMSEEDIINPQPGMVAPPAYIPPGDDNGSGDNMKKAMAIGLPLVGVGIIWSLL